MPTTTIRIDDDLKARIAAVAKVANKTPHAFIVDALADATERAEAAAELRHIANQRWVALQESGKSVPWDDAKRWLRSRAAGQAAQKPKPRNPTHAR